MNKSHTRLHDAAPPSLAEEGDPSINMDQFLINPELQHGESLPEASKDTVYSKVPKENSAK